MTNITDRYARANHFTTKKVDLIEPLPSSKFRNEKSNELINKIDKNNANIEDLRTILNYETEDYYKSIFKSPKKYTDQSITVANFSYDVENNVIEIIDYLSDSKLMLEYNEF